MLFRRLQRVGLTEAYLFRGLSESLMCTLRCEALTLGPYVSDA